MLLVDTLGSNNLLQESRFVAKDADDADCGLDYGVVSDKIDKLQEKCILFTCFSTA